MNITGTVPSNNPRQESTIMTHTSVSGMSLRKKKIVNNVYQHGIGHKESVLPIR